MRSVCIKLIDQNLFDSLEKIEIFDYKIKCK